MEEKITGILAAAAGVAATEAAELLTTDEGIATLQSKVTAKLADVKKNEGNRVLKDTRKAVEEVLKSAGVSAEVFEEGRGFKENITAAVEVLQSQSLTTGAKDLTPEQILKLEPVVRLKNEMTLDADRRVKAAETAAADALKKDREDFAKEQTLVGVRAWADTQIDLLKPNFSDNTAIAANQRAILRDQIIGAGTYRKEGDGYVLLDASGEIIRDSSENVLNPADKARLLAESLFGLPVSDPKASPGVKQSDVAAHDASYTGPTTQADYEAKLVLTAPGSAERAKLVDDWRGYKDKNQPAA